MTTKFSRQSSPRHRISGPGELLQAIPYLLGFHPQSSLVLVGLGDRRGAPRPEPRAGRATGVGAARELVVTARLDLTDATESGVLDDTLSAIRGGGADDVLAVVYDDRDPSIDADRLPWSQLAGELDDCVAAAGCRLVDVLFVAHGRWWPYNCADPGCCPRWGRPVPEQPSPFTAAATYAGVVALPDRDALAAVLNPLPEARLALSPFIEAAENAVVAAMLNGHQQRHFRSVKRAIFAAARASADPRQEPLPDEVTAQFAVALSDTALRDSVWLAVDNARLDGRPLWRDLARRAPGPYAAAPLFLFGWANWRAGNGALASIAAEQAIDCDPDYSAADLLVAALSRGLDPHQMPKLRMSRSA